MYCKKSEILSTKSETNSNDQNDSFAVILSEAKNLLFVAEVLRLRLRTTHKCHFEHLRFEF